MKKVYTIENIEKVLASRLIAHVSIDENNPIFEGHFPEKPILPGVVELEIIKKIISQFFKKDFQLRSIKNAKYLGMILPQDTTYFQVDIDFKNKDGLLNVKALIHHQSKKYLKFSGDYSSND